MKRRRTLDQIAVLVGHYNFSQHDLKIIIYTDQCTFFVLVVSQGNGDY